MEKTPCIRLHSCAIDRSCHSVVLSQVRKLQQAQVRGITLLQQPCGDSTQVSASLITTTHTEELLLFLLLLGQHVLYYCIPYLTLL